MKERASRSNDPKVIRLRYLRKRHRIAKANLRLKNQAVGPLTDRLSHTWWQAEAKRKALGEGDK